VKERLTITPGAEGFALFRRAPLVRIPSHRHEELEVNLILSGSAAYLFGLKRVPLAAGSMIWLFPEQEHVLIDCSHDFALWVLVFKPELAARFAKQPGRETLGLADPGDILCRRLDPGTADTFHAIYQTAAVGAEDLLLCNTALAYALAASWEAFTFSREPAPRSDVHPAVARAVRVISEAEETLALDDIAQRAGLSAPRLSRLFKKQTGISLTHFRQRKCLERFFRIYRAGARFSLIEAALQAGFGSYPQFHRVFRQHMRQSPAEYARKARSG